MNGVIVLLIILGLILLGMIWLIIWEIKRRNDFSVIAHFINDSKHLEKKRYKKITEKFSYKEETYFYDDKTSIIKGKSKHVYYIKGFSAPIDFTLSQEQLQLKYNSATIEKILKNNLIQKMLDDLEGSIKSQETRLIMYLIGVVIVILFGVHLMLSGDNASVTCTLANNNQTINIIKEAVVNGIRG